MAILSRILGAAFLLLGLIILAPAVVLLNQRYQFIHITWGLFDPQLNGQPIAEVAIAAIFAITGVLLALLGVLLLIRRQKPL